MFKPKMHKLGTLLFEQNKNVNSSLQDYTSENNSFASFVSKCEFCNNSSHEIYSYSKLKLKNLTPIETIRFIKSKKMCFNCFNSQQLIHCI